MTAEALLPGMSGAPVIRDSDGTVVGVVSGRYNSADGWLAQTVWVTRSEDLVTLLDGLDGIADIQLLRLPAAGAVDPGVLTRLRPEAHGHFGPRARDLLPDDLPDPRSARSFDEFAGLLRRLRELSGLSYETLGRMAQARAMVLSRSTLNDALMTPGRLPKMRQPRQLIEGFLDLIEMPEDAARLWLDRFDELMAEYSGSAHVSRPIDDPAPHVDTQTPRRATEESEAPLDAPRRSFPPVDFGPDPLEVARPGPALSPESAPGPLPEPNRSLFQRRPTTRLGGHTRNVGPDRGTFIRRGSQIAAGLVLVLLAGSAVVWWAGRQHNSPASEPAKPGPGGLVDLRNPVVISPAGSPGLRLGVWPTREGSPAAIVEPGTGDGAVGVWDFVPSDASVPGFRQLRVHGTMLMCLEPVDPDKDSAGTRTWECHEDQSHQWTAVRASGGTFMIRNEQTGHCLKVAGTPLAGTAVLHAPCERATRWEIKQAPALPTVEPLLLPDKRGIPGQGDKQCAIPDRNRLDVQENDLASGAVQVPKPRGFIGYGPTAYVQLSHGNRRSAGGREETFYWAEGMTHVDPADFQLALQWTKVPGDSDWHTCTTKVAKGMTVENTPAIYKRGPHDPWFRACFIYRPHGLGVPSVQCTDRY